MNRFYFIGFIWLFVLLFTPAYGQDNGPDMPQDIQANLIRTASDIQAIQARLQTLDASIITLEKDGAVLEARYAKSQQQIARTALAITRLSAVPRAAILVRPGGALEGARTSALLGGVIPSIEKQSAEVRQLLTDLQKNRQALKDQIAEAETRKAALEIRATKLNALIKTRQAAVAAQAPAWAREAAQAEKLARSARTLRDFLNKGEQATPPREDTNVFSSGGTDTVMPLSGIIRVAYGQPDDTGSPSRGIGIEGLPTALVVAPMGGIVKYAGPFRGYGQVVLLAHAGKVFSFLAGLGDISVVTGQNVAAGEPIARLDNGDSSGRARLYFELRLNGQPVNPAVKLGGL